MDGKIVKEACGGEDESTNNRMELKALIEGFKMLKHDEHVVMYSDSQLCVNTLTKWAAAWSRNGWARGKKREPVMNLDLVQEAFELSQAHPNVEVAWIKGHAGAQWNEYADVLASKGAEPGD